MSLLQATTRICTGQVYILYSNVAVVGGVGEKGNDHWRWMQKDPRRDMHRPEALLFVWFVLISTVFGG